MSVNFSLEGKIALVTGASYGMLPHTQRQERQSASTILSRS
jgi:hypothetical protein